LLFTGTGESFRKDIGGDCLRNDYRTRKREKDASFRESISVKFLQKGNKSLLSLLTRKQTKKHTLFRVSSLVYLVFLIASLSISPTTAHFADESTVDGSISTAETFGEEEQKEEDNNQASEETEEDKSTSNDESKEEQEQLVESEKKEENNSSSESEKDHKQTEENEANAAEDTKTSSQDETKDETEKSDSQGEDDGESER